MLKDVLLIWKFRSGDSNALAKIYEDHRLNLLLRVQVDVQ